MIRQEDIKKHIRELFIGQKLAVLSTHRSGGCIFGKRRPYRDFFCHPANDTESGRNGKFQKGFLGIKSRSADTKKSMDNHQGL